MSDEGLPRLDAVVIARSVRDLANRAHRALVLQADEDEARELYEALLRLERQIDPGKSADLGRWLANLRRRVEGRLPTAV